MPHNNTTNHTDKPLIGCLLALFAFLSLSLAGVFSKMVTGQVPGITIFFFQFAICLLLCLPWVFRQGVWRIKTKRLPLHIMRDLGGMISYIFFLYSLHTVPLVNATLLLYASPLWVPLILLVWLKIKVESKLWWGIIIGFIGMICVLHPTGSAFIHLGVIFALLSGILYAYTTVAVRLLLSTEPPDRILFYLFLVCAIASLPFVLLHWQPLSLHQWVVLIAAGFAMFACQFAFTQCLRFINASVAAIFAYTGVVFSGVFGFLFWHHVPDFLGFLGIFLVILGGTLTILMVSKKKK